MNSQLDIAQDISLNDEILRDLLDNEIILVGGGESATSLY
jgi:hypothetical protein